MAGEDDSQDSNHHRKRQDILEAAAAVFWERGYSAGTTKDVAQRVGLSQPTIYHYIGSKSTLLEEIVSEVYAQVLKGLEEARKLEHNPEERLRAIVHSLTRAITERRDMFGVFWQEFRQLSEEFQVQVRRDQRAFLDEIEAVVAEMQQTGRLGPTRSPAVIASAILGMVSWTYQWYRPEGNLDPDALADTFLDLIGLGEAPSR
jgi:AcrR family transcriptional regulator